MNGQQTMYFLNPEYLLLRRVGAREWTNRYDYMFSFPLAVVLGQYCSSTLFLSIVRDK